MGLPGGVVPGSTSFVTPTSLDRSSYAPRSTCPLVMRGLPSKSADAVTTPLFPTSTAGESARRRRFPALVGAVAGSTGVTKRGSAFRLPVPQIAPPMLAHPPSTIVWLRVMPFAVPFSI